MKKASAIFFVCSFLIGSLFISQVGFANNHQKHGRMGSHGMVLLTDGEHLFASHLPLYRKPHDMQIIYEIDAGSQQKSLIAMAEIGMMTLLPEVFDLDLLVNGKTPTFDTQFYNDHFERGGTKWQTHVAVQFKAAKYLRPLGDLVSVAETTYQKLTIGQSTKFLLIREIAPAPSADHVLVMEKVSSEKCAASGFASNSFDWQSLSLDDQRNELKKSFGDCFKLLNEYWETADFAE